MKFEIDEHGRFVTKGFRDNEPERLVSTNEVISILQAVKKTQTKLINKDIQEIQDSKHTPNAGNYLSEKEVQTIEQNQKIVDALKSVGLQLLSEGIKFQPMDISMTELHRSEIILTWLGHVINETTGKAIKDL